MVANRIIYLDILRILACVMIVLMHSPLPDLGTPNAILSSINLLTAPGIGLFVMISGALLLKKQSSAPFSTKQFITRRCRKIVLPLFCWTCVYWLLQLLEIEFTGLNVLWFLWMLLGLYLITPILQRWLFCVSKNEIQFYLSLWTISLLFPWFQFLVENYPWVGQMPFLVRLLDDGIVGWLFYFQGYVGYYVLGFYLSTYSDISKKQLGWLIMCTVMASWVLPYVVSISGLSFHFVPLFWYLSLGCVMQCCCWFLIIKLLTEKRIMPKDVEPFIIHISSLSFGIYLVHILIMRGYLWRTIWMQNMNGIVQIFVCCILTLIGSFFISWVLGKSRYTKWLIGM